MGVNIPGSNNLEERSYRLYVETMMIGQDKATSYIGGFF